MALSALAGGRAIAAADPWAEADKIVSGMTKVHFPDRSVSITEYGAVADDPDRLAHEAINLAIVEMSRSGGGTVVVPDGTFYTGPITMKSNVRLHLSDKAVLKFSTDISLYFPAVLTRWEGLDCYNARPLIYAYGETNIALTGKGTIDGQASRENWWGRQRSVERNDFTGPPGRGEDLRRGGLPAPADRQLQPLHHGAHRGRDDAPLPVLGDTSCVLRRPDGARGACGQQRPQR